MLNCGVGNLLLSPLDCKEIKPVNPKGNQSWIFIGRTEAKADAPILWPPDAKNWTEKKKCKELEKTLMLGKIAGRRTRGQQRMTWLDGITNSMDRVWASSRSWWWMGKPGMLQSMGRKEMDTAEWLNWAVLLLPQPSLWPPSPSC